MPITCGAGCAAPEVRARWGCDAPVAATKQRLGAFFVDCWVCRGERPTCRVCAKPGDTKHEATGRVWFQRCPTALWEPWVGPFLSTVSAYREGFLPVAGGVLDQAQAWREGLQVALPHLRECERIAADRAAKAPR